jgi:hypothetical protein
VCTWSKGHNHQPCACPCNIVSIDQLQCHQQQSSTTPASLGPLASSGMLRMSPTPPSPAWLPCTTHVPFPCATCACKLWRYKCSHKHGGVHAQGAQKAHRQPVEQAQCNQPFSGVWLAVCVEGSLSPGNDKIRLSEQTRQPAGVR